MQYTPLWTSILRSPKVFALDAESFRFWAFCLVLAQEHDRTHGALPDVESIAFTLRMDVEDAVRLIASLVAARFIDATPGGYQVHDWKRWRGGKEDPTSAERKRRERDRRRSSDPNVTPVTRDIDVTVVTRDTPVTPCHGSHACHATEHTGQNIQDTPQPPKGGGVVEAEAEGLVATSGEDRPSALRPAPRPDSRPAAPPPSPLQVSPAAPAASPPGSAAWKAVVDSVPAAWGQSGESACLRLLEVFPAEVVAYGMEKVQDNFDGGFPRGAAGYWRTVCQNNPEGRPKARAAKAAPPPATLKFSVPKPEEIYHPARLAKMREAGRA